MPKDQRPKDLRPPNGPLNVRLDLHLLELGLFPTRQAAQTAIMDGGILVDGKIITKAGTNVSQSAKVEILPGWGKPKYVSRGGLKLEKAIQEFDLTIKDRICLDIGASTGGFTDCLLQHHAAQVYAIDVGYGQLDWSLRQDKRVVVKEKINARNLNKEMLYETNDPQKEADLAVMDVSFISLTKILPAALTVMSKNNIALVCLIKPQFEAGRESVGKGGVVKSPAVHIEVINKIIQESSVLGLHAHKLTFSPLKGPAGNIEYLILFKRELPIQTFAIEEIVKNTVDNAHQTLSN